MKARTGFLALALALGVASPAVGRSHMLTYRCNADGTYVCGSSCEVGPYKGIGCCAKF